MPNKDKKDVEDYNDPTKGSQTLYSGEKIPFKKSSRDRRAANQEYVGKYATTGLGDEYKSKTAYQKSWIAKGEKASDSARMDKMDAKRRALRMLMAKKRGVDMYEPGKADMKDRNAAKKRYR